MSDSAALPVARFLAPEEQRYSLQHLMLAADRAYQADDRLDERARRRFGFLCGSCGAQHNARVFEIAAEMKCEPCGALMIVPAPLRDSTRPGGLQQHLYCSQCGRAVQGDRSRHNSAFCSACDAWF